MAIHRGVRMIIGKAVHTVNKDGRLSIPSKMRDVIKKKYDADDLYLVLMDRNFIGLYPSVEFEKLTTRLLSNPEGGNLQELLEIERMASDAEPCRLDSSGRIVIPPLMREAAGIGVDSEVMVVGAMTHIEIWEKVFWNYNRRQAGSVVGKFKAFAAQS